MKLQETAGRVRCNVDAEKQQHGAGTLSVCWPIARLCEKAAESVAGMTIPGGLTASYRRKRRMRILLDFSLRNQVSGPARPADMLKKPAGKNRNSSTKAATERADSNGFARYQTRRDSDFDADAVASVRPTLRKGLL